MSESTEPLRDLLSELESSGAKDGTGRFTLDPVAAVERLRAQGRLGKNAPLYLLAALYRRAPQGSVECSKGPWSWRLEGGGPAASASLSVDEELAVHSFAAHQVDLRWEGRAAVLRPRGVLPRAHEVLEPLFREQASRLVHFPWAGATRGPFLTSPTWTEAELGFLEAPGDRGHFLHRVSGVLFPRPWGLPVDAVDCDDQARPDLSWSVIPDQERVAARMARAEERFLEGLEESLLRSGPQELTGEPFPDPPLFLRFLGYLLQQSRRPELARQAADQVTVIDVTGGRWPLSRLLEVVDAQGRLFTVPVATTFHGPLAPLPVVPWGGLLERALQGRCPVRQPGEGYLFSLRVNQRERSRHSPLGESALAVQDFPSGRLSLLPWGETDRVAELEVIGRRRARETQFLSWEAPQGLRLVWESSPEGGTEFHLEDGLAQVQRALPALLEQALPEPPDWSLWRPRLLEALSWSPQAPAEAVTGCPRLADAPLFAALDGRYFSLRQVAARQRLEVVADRSTSLPKRLPEGPVFWWHPLLGRLGLPWQDVGQSLRRTAWQEEGRERWLAAHAPGEPPCPEGAWRQGAHWVASVPGARDTEVLFWREGRPFGRVRLGPERCPPGYWIAWVEDALPADDYWSGPDLSALEERLPELSRLCRPWPSPAWGEGQADLA